MIAKNINVLSVFINWWQRVRVWLVALARTKLVNKSEPEEIPRNFQVGDNQAINYTRLKFTIFSFIDIIRKNKREN